MANQNNKKIIDRTIHRERETGKNTLAAAAAKYTAKKSRLWKEHSKQRSHEQEGQRQKTQTTNLALQTEKEAQMRDAY